MITIAPQHENIWGRRYDSMHIILGRSCRFHYEDGNKLEGIEKRKFSLQCPESNPHSWINQRFTLLPL